jgi:hypothetical protein
MGLRVDLNGYRLRKTFKDAPIYLIDEGAKRHIADPPTYDALFRDWDGIVSDIDIDDIDDGPQIEPGTMLFRVNDTKPVYLLDIGKKQKRLITSPAAMDKYHFNWDRVQKDPGVSLMIAAVNPISE